jgi:hypothetical protein
MNNEIQKPRWLWRWVRRFFPKPHIWKETKRETLGRFTHWGDSPHEITELYRIGIYETCLLSGAKRIRTENKLRPEDTPNAESTHPE